MATVKQLKEYFDMISTDERKDFTVVPQFFRSGEIKEAVCIPEYKTIILTDDSDNVALQYAYIENVNDIEIINYTTDFIFYSFETNENGDVNE